MKYLLVGLLLAPICAAQTSSIDARLSVEESLSAWRKVHGSAWALDREPGRSLMLFGGRAPAKSRPRTPAEFEQGARSFVLATEGIHSVEAEHLQPYFTRTLPLGVIGSTDKTTVRFRQVVQGIPVVDGWTNVLMTQDGALLSLQTTAIPGAINVSLRPIITPGDARRTAAGTLQRVYGIAPNDVSEAELWIDRLRDQEAQDAVLVWRVKAGWYEPGFDPVGLEVFVDAESGAVLRTENTVHFCGGDVSGTVLTNATPGSAADTGTNPPVLIPAAHIEIDTNSGTFLTDENGNFSVPGAGSLSNIEVLYRGDFAAVATSAGERHQLNVSSISGSGNTLVMNPSPTEFVTAQANAFVGINDLRDWIRDIIPGDDTADFRATAITNINDSCNAFFNGSSVNFFRASGGCNNTSFSTIVAHEMGHWLNVLYGTGNGNDGMGEGNADVFAMYLYDTAIVGQGFSTSGGSIRNGNNTRQFCGNCCPGCYGQVHTDGQVWMGAAWKVRANLKSSLGSAAGSLTADTLFLSWMNAYNATGIRNSIDLQWLVLDDDDGVVENGAPHYSEINAGFVTQGFPGFNLRDIAFTNVNNPGNTADEAGPYRIQGRMEANFNPPLVRTELVYRIDGAAWQTLPMAEYQPDFYEAFIPGQAQISTVEWYLTAEDSAAVELNFPAGGTQSPRGFLIADVRTIFFDNFTIDRGWTTENESLSSGAFERGAPEGTFAGNVTVQPAADFGAGTRCYFTGSTAPGAGTGENDVDGGPTRLISPAFNFSNPLGPDYEGVIDYAFWLYNDDGNEDAIVVELSNGGPWIQAASHSGLLGGWNENHIIISDFVTPNETVRVRFSVADNPNNSITEAAIDEVRIWSTQPPPCVDPTPFCEAEFNSTGFRSRMLWDGTTSVAANDLALIAIDLPPFTNGIFIYSQEAVDLPLGNGRLCLGTEGIGFIIRLPAESANMSGTMTHAFDNTAPPVPIGQITPGSTWKFQCWFRDNAAGGSFFNLSNGLSVTFCQ